MMPIVINSNALREQALMERARASKQAYVEHVVTLKGPDGLIRPLELGETHDELNRLRDEMRAAERELDAYLRGEAVGT